MMLYYYLLYFFIAVGAKLALAAVMIYLLLPSQTRCAGCDGETILLRPGAPGRVAARLLGGRVQRRWCPGCGDEHLARRAPVRAAISAGHAPPHTRTEMRAQWDRRP